MQINHNLKSDLKNSPGNGNYANKNFESSTLNSILKNSSSKQNGTTHGQTKNISFGGPEP
jgi:hypothetical protein